jgi:hypothetical protein
VRADGRSVLISVPHGGAAGNMIRTGIVSRILDADRDVRVVVLSPMVQDSEFVREVSHPRVTFEDLLPHTPERLEARLLALMQAAYIDSGVTRSVQIRRMEAQAKGTIRWIGLKRRLAKRLAPSLVVPATRYALSDRSVSHQRVESMFERYRPIMLVTSSPGLIFSEVPLLRTAARRGVWSMAIDPSWDNFTNKLLPVRRVDRLIVWNDLMKQQAVQLHGYDENQIRVTGTPQWDRYFRDGVTVSREMFLRRIGAKPDRRLVTVTTTPRELYPHHDHVLRVLVDAIRRNRLAVPAQILVRLHPRDEMSHYSAFEDIPEVIVEKPFRRTVRSSDGLAVDVTAESQQHLADTLYHSDVIVNVASTIAIEAAIFNTPVVNVSFDGERESDFVRSARRYYEFTHYVNITRHRAVRVATTPDDLVIDVNRYLADPSLDSEGRRRVVKEQCQFLDGRSAERVADAVLDDLRRLTGRETDHATCAALQASSH